VIYSPLLLSRIAMPFLTFFAPTLTSGSAIAFRLFPTASCPHLTERSPTLLLGSVCHLCTSRMICLQIPTSAEEFMKRLCSTKRLSSSVQIVESQIPANKLESVARLFVTRAATRTNFSPSLIPDVELGPASQAADSALCNSDCNSFMKAATSCSPTSGLRSSR